VGDEINIHICKPSRKPFGSQEGLFFDTDRLICQFLVFSAKVPLLSVVRSRIVPYRDKHVVQSPSNPSTTTLHSTDCCYPNEE
jgi:hypothetical protein